MHKPGQIKKLFFTPNVEVDEADRTSNIAGIPITSDLGDTSAHSSSTIGMAKFYMRNFLERRRKRMEGWKTKYLSLMGRITLAKSIICGLPIYQTQSALLPSSVTKELDRLVRRCIWVDRRINASCIW